MSNFNLIWGYICIVMGIIMIIGYSAKGEFLQAGLGIFVIILGVALIDEHKKK